MIIKALISTGMLWRSVLAYVLLSFTELQGFLCEGLYFDNSFYFYLLIFF